MKKLAVIILLVLFTSTSYAGLKSLKCKKGFIQIGDLSYSVTNKCGEAQQESKVSGDNRDKVVKAIYNINNWSYSFTFEAGKLTDIERLK